MTGPMRDAEQAEAVLTEGVVLTDHVRFLSLDGALKLGVAAVSIFRQWRRKV